jgi:hypothetical protein
VIGVNSEQKITELEKRVEVLEKATAATAAISLDLDGREIAKCTLEHINSLPNREGR